MGFLDGLMGNVSEIENSQVESELKDLLASSEKVEHAYKLIRDLIVFTNKRLLLIDKQGMSGKKVEYHSIPYRSIVHFSIETAGTFDLDAELKIWLSGSSVPIQKKFNKTLNIYKVQSVLAEYVMR
ncbi:PH domain-containing protein [Psychrobacillus psychrotolerans]|uniref:PH domain-containing protein n=1 Tax=Psychrobacillus psychrotolerans TaxID=126156 RepID=A0A1I5XYE4_9BACI|nr:PH domain-containing protein [Psychrobacillus psychrotolerans]SFQ36968.1 PH domain-containing protein [Psychrobacillus psychrotolerans]